ncbi:hypothetical protein [Anaplasma phagocytophilum]|uniref:hypothetical protein n=1 Tax=Anaplasma phagocytophilum TaxID=948 RepID=UPI00035AAB0D|nr:hypothetical protein [Anaplasma phagocytophilum]EOA60959.1 hypothetical protein HGE1_02827 [Anaplasma phagocytophilum str. HGE1]
MLSSSFSLHKQVLRLALQRKRVQKQLPGYLEQHKSFKKKRTPLSSTALSYTEREKIKKRERNAQQYRCNIAFQKPTNTSFVLRLTEQQRGVSAVIQRMRKVTIAHGMDPVQRAGQTKSSNEKDAARFGRVPKGKKRTSAMSFLKMLLKFLLMLLFPIMFCSNLIVKGILKDLQSRHKPTKKTSRRPFSAILLLGPFREENLVFHDSRKN